MMYFTFGLICAATVVDFAVVRSRRRPWYATALWLATAATLLLGRW